MARTGRPKKAIEQEDFEALLRLQCTLDEVQAFFESKLGGCSVDTIERWCMRTYGETFAEVSRKNRSLGRISLRRAQFQMALKSVPMNIWLSKQYLGQKDNPVDDEERKLKLSILKLQEELNAMKLQMLNNSSDDSSSRQVIIINDTIGRDDAE